MNPITRGARLGLTLELDSRVVRIQTMLPCTRQKGWRWDLTPVQSAKILTTKVEGLKDDGGRLPSRVLVDKVSATRQSLLLLHIESRLARLVFAMETASLSKSRRFLS